MFNLFDILQHQSGGLQGFGQQFGLSPDQTRRAMEALLPALSIGLQRNAEADPTGFGRLFGLVGPEAAKTGFTPPPTQTDQVLGHLFGSPLVAQAVLQQASLASGVGAQALRQMLPVMAGMIVAGIVHLMLNQPANAPAVAPAPAGPQPFAPGAAFWGDWFRSVLTPPAAPSAPAPSPPRQGARPARRDPAPKPTAPAADMGMGIGSWQQLFQTGAEVQEQNFKAMQDIFDTLWGTTKTSAEDTGTKAQAGGQPTRRASGSRREE